MLHSADDLPLALPLPGRLPTTGGRLLAMVPSKETGPAEGKRMNKVQP